MLNGKNKSGWFFDFYIYFDANLLSASPIIQIQFIIFILYNIIYYTLGYETVDLNGRVHTGFAIAQTTSRNGSRLSTARAFLRPARNRRNLHIMLNSTATRILFDRNKKAVGVEFLHDNELHRVSVDKEVIVSGGRFHEKFRAFFC